MNLIRYQLPQRLNSVAASLSRRAAFQNEVERLFDLPLFGAEARRAEGFVPALDLYQDAEKLVLKAELPGLAREDFSLTLHDGDLTLSGERRQEKAHEEKGSLRNERAFGKFERVVTLPFAVDATRVSASYDNGVLTVSLPKAEEAKPRQIEIK